MYRQTATPGAYRRCECLLAVLPLVKRLAIFELSCREPLVAFRSFSFPPDLVLQSAASTLLVYNPINEELVLSINQDRVGWLQCSFGEKLVVVFREWLDLRGVEHWEHEGVVWEI